MAMVLDNETRPDPPVKVARVTTHLLGLNPAELCVLGAALLVPLAFALQDFATFLTPKAALLLLFVGPGLCVLGVSCLRRDVASWWAAGFLAVAAVATAWSDVPALSAIGSYGWANGLLFVASLVAFWALGRTLGPRARELLAVVLLVGALVNAAWAWIQMTVDLGQPAFRPFMGRAMGFMGNPVQLGALCAAAMWLAAARTRTRLWPSLVALGVLAGAVQLSGSRIALAAGIAAIVSTAVRAGWRRGCLLLGAVIVGILVAMAVPTTGISSTQRVAGATSDGLAPRVALWRSAAEGLADRPLIGYGPGRFFVAATPHASLTTARYTGGDILYADAHNFVVDYATTTGVIGLIALGGFLIAASRRARGPLVGFVIVAGITMLFQPQYVGLTPLVLLALGASGPRLHVFESTEGPGANTAASRIAFAGLCVATVLLGAVGGYRLITGDADFKHAQVDRSLEALGRADQQFPPWPDIPAERSSLYAARRFVTGVTRYEGLAIRSDREAVRRDPADPQWTFQLANLEEASRHNAEAARLYDRALALNPWSVNALSGAYRVAVRTERNAAARVYRAKLCEIGKSSCPPPPAEYRAQLGA